MKKKFEREREREEGGGGRGSNLFCVRKLCIEWKRKCEIYSKMLRIRIVKIQEDKRATRE